RALHRSLLTPGPSSTSRTTAVTVCRKYQYRSEPPPQSEVLSASYVSPYDRTIHTHLMVLMMVVMPTLFCFFRFICRVTPRLQTRWLRAMIGVAIATAMAGQHNHSNHRRQQGNAGGLEHQHGLPQ